MQKPGIPEGTRDFGPEQVRKRTYIFDTIRTVFTQYGFQPLETPSMENLNTLTGKYGEEGDKLLFKILNNGDFLKDADAAALHEKDSAKVLPVIAKRGLRYDLTVPFARYVAMNRGQLTFPFKRYQIQPVWRADRPQRGRYREFYQCDADVIGSDSLLLEAELVQIYDRAFAQLGVPVTIKMNHRKVLLGIAEAAGIPNQFMDMTVAVDKLDKIGIDGVKNELQQRGIGAAAIAVIEQALSADGLDQLRPLLANTASGQEGLTEVERVMGFLSTSKLQNVFKIDVTLARGLTYYTGCIFEVAANGVQMGSIGGGGRYADLTGVFGVPGLSGVGISFGADRIYDVMEQLDVFPASLSVSVQLLIASFDDSTLEYAFQCAARLREAGVPTEVYPESGKLKKQFEYAAKRNVPFVAIAGEAEMQQQSLTIKNQADGTQESLSLADCIARLAK
jgi:histidyl-tRNA synthetase